MPDIITADAKITPAVSVPPAADVASGRLSRRRALIATFWAGIGTLVVAGVGSVLNSLYPRNVTGFGGPISVLASRIPGPGDAPRSFAEGRFVLVNLESGEGAMPGDEARSPGGLVALYKKCPHLGCTIPWKSDARYKDLRGVFLCPCHGSTYTRAGVRVFGPAPRSMDTMAIEVSDSGDIIVQTGSITEGGTDNPARAVPYRSTAQT
ncbi:MAG: ubiquinol-cytochrome c reductase iron-sulfur subunit [Dehalococcoidia bacterium]